MYEELIHKGNRKMCKYYRATYTNGIETWNGHVRAITLDGAKLEAWNIAAKWNATVVDVVELN